MNQTAKLPLFAVLVTWPLVACGSQERAVPVPDSAATETEAAVSAEAQVQAGAPKIAAGEPVHDFGAIKATDTVEHVFKIHNEGTADLKIERVQRT
jgi:hypothetical protein